MKRKHPSPAGFGDALDSFYGSNKLLDAVRKFADSVYQNIGAVIEPIPDGTLHRFDDPEGKRHNRACWYVLHLDGCPAGIYGNWRTGLEVRWNERIDRKVTAEEYERHRIKVRHAIEKREREKAQSQKAAAHLAEATWELAAPPEAEHPYLIQKRIPGNFLRQTRGTLLVMLQDIDGNSANLQRIYPDGNKRFLKGGRVSGCFWLCGNDIPDAGTLYIAEGVATAATLALELRRPVVAAMNAGNLEPVARAIRAHYPDLDLVIAADNDHHTPGNPGLTKAEAAARAVGGGLIKPALCGEEYCACTDFNDLGNCCNQRIAL